MNRPPRCAHCSETRRDVTLWRQILALGPTACCWLPDLQSLKDVSDPSGTLTYNERSTA